MSKHIRVLQIAGGFRDNINGEVVSGGVPSFLHSYCVKLDSSKYTFDFLALKNQCFEPYREEFESMGSKLYNFNLQSNGAKRAVETISCLKALIDKNHYDVVHINMGSFFPVLTCAIAAKLAGVKLVVAHSHSSGMYSKKKRIIANIFSPLLSFTADKYCACSTIAAENLFSYGIVRRKKYRIIRNAIDVSKYKFNKVERNNIRAGLNINENDTVIGHVGRMVEVKNHRFIIETFFEYLKLNSHSKLLLVGDGEMRPQIEKRIDELDIKDHVILVGQQKETWKYYQAMDMFLLPSFVEGLGIVAIEAQASGLPCYVSENVPDEVFITPICKRVKLSSGAQTCAHTLAESEYRNYNREMFSELVKKAGYDLKDNIRSFEELYKK